MFKNSRLILDFILYRRKIHISYSVLTEGLNTKVVITINISSSLTSFTTLWFLAGATLSISAVFTSFFLIRNVKQQLIHQREYLKIRKLFTQMLTDEKLKETFSKFFAYKKIPKIHQIKMKPSNLNKNLLLEFCFDSPQIVKELIKIRKELRLIKNPTPKQIEQIITNKNMINHRKWKTVFFFKNFINKIINNKNDV